MNAESAPASQKKILVVEDNEVILKTISLKLQGAGFKIITALDGSEAVAAARRETPDLILLDINFPPAVDGVPGDDFRIMDWFHRLDPAKKIPIIITDRKSTRLNSSHLGISYAVFCLKKPVRRAVLLDDPTAAYGGTGTYELSPWPDPSPTTLRITETVFIIFLIYRAAMAHSIFPTHNLVQY